MFSDPIRVASEVLAARDARFDDLLFPTGEGPRRGKSPVVTQPRCPLSPELGQQTGLYMQRGYIYIGGSHVFLNTHVHTVP
ncbi:hypothetical protein PBY51_006098 [Eleginops maclovinus]|uniref:Uncharacterized protein n=1 Tax=Eleginops maclovinus TaxID=56733 RepID=A0AAN7WTQ7_ELEMC|nr:hypothetical protein PBY51_006098 [Eleginops maclovinus]